MSLYFLQAFYGLFLGQAHLLILVGIVLALWLAEREKFWLAGGVLAVVALIKFFPLLLVVYYLARRRFRVVGGAALVGASLIAFMLAWTSPATLARSLSAAFTAVSAQRSAGGNEAFLIITSAPGLLLAVAIGLVWLGVAPRRGGDDLLGAGWTLCTMLLISPLVWPFYLVWLVPTWCACFAALGPLDRVNLGGWRIRGGWAALALLYLVVALPLSLTLRPYATLALWALTGALYWRSGAADRRAPTGVPIGEMSASHSLGGSAAPGG